MANSSKHKIAEFLQLSFLQKESKEDVTKQANASNPSILGEKGSFFSINKTVLE